jgi:hypothetical protein
MLDGLSRSAADCAALNHAYLDAAARSTQLWTAGLQDLGQRCFGAAQGMTDRFQATTRTLASAKSVGEAAEIQAAHIRAAVGQAVTQATDLQRAALQLVQQASAPMAEHLTAVSATMTARTSEA